MPQWTKTAEERLADRYIKTPGGCWYWTGRTDRDGYGRIDYQSRDYPAHRAMMMTQGHDVAGLDVDHLCRRRRCVNPLHLDVVTRAENNRRQWVARGLLPRRQYGGACVNGHGFTPENTYIAKNGRRICRTCTRAIAGRSRARKAAALATSPAPTPNADETGASA